MSSNAVHPAAPEAALAPDPLLCEKKCVHPAAVSQARAGLPGPRDLLAAAEFFKVFGDQTRLSLLSALRSGELCVCDLAAALGMSDSAVSHQLAVLRRSGLILPRREGKIVYYRLADRHVETIIDFAFEHLREGIGDSLDGTAARGAQEASHD